VGAWRSWQLGSTGSPLYRLFDLLRQGLNRRLVEFLSHALASDGDAIVLEAGSGPAYGSSLLAQHPAVRLSIALDIDPSALAEARRRDPALISVVADLNALPFPASCFDLIWNSSTMEHIDAPLPALFAFSHALKADGRLFIGVPYCWGPLGVQKLFPRTPVGVWIGSVFSMKELERLLQTAGFSRLGSLTYFLRFFVGILAGKSLPRQRP
jgi:SAM-dependent methyltransferase